MLAIKNTSSGSLCATRGGKILAGLAIFTIVSIGIIVGATYGAGLWGCPEEVPQFTNVLFAQTHVIPPEGLRWSQGSNMTLKLVGSREALFMFKFPNNASFGPELFVFGFNAKGTYLGSSPVSLPQNLPVVESNQTNSTFGEFYSALLPKEWIAPNFALKLGSRNVGTCVSNATSFSEVTADSEIDIWILPMYFYGANETNTAFLNETQVVSEVTKKEMYAKLPIAKLNVKVHEMKANFFRFAVAPPRNGNPAFIMTDRVQETDGFQTMSIILGLIGQIRQANGHVNSQYYAPMMTLRNGVESGAGGGLGGGSVATGDSAYTGIFIHELGHGWGMPHSNDGYLTNNFPYVGGSLLGSSWGYDSLRKLFLPPSIPPSASTYRNCQSDANRQKENGKCIKQDYMQGGSGDQTRGDKFTMNADYNAGLVQRYANRATYFDSNSPTGFSKWEPVNKTRIPVEIKTTGSAQYGLDSGLPYVQNVPVFTILVAYSYVTSQARRFYTPIEKYTGNLIRQIDPTNATDRAFISSGGNGVWFCVNSGCDYTLKMTYQDDSTIHSLIRGGFRSFNKPDEIHPDATNPTSGASFALWGINFPADKDAKKVELLSTPRANLNGISGATVLLTHTF